MLPTINFLQTPPDTVSHAFLQIISSGYGALSIVILSSLIVSSERGEQGENK
jgi:hypothetical protein